MRILKSLQTRILEVLILQGLREDDCGQKTEKRGVGLYMRIAKGLRQRFWYAVILRDLK